jgi:hypothetical protein
MQIVGSFIRFMKGINSLTGEHIFQFGGFIQQVFEHFKKITQVDWGELIHLKTN